MIAQVALQNLYCNEGFSQNEIAKKLMITLDKVRYWLKVYRLNAPVKRNPVVPVKESIFTRYTIDDSGCWNYTGNIHYSGYGRVGVGRKLYMAHRVFYQKFKGEIPEDKIIDHLCRNRKCVNPAHLELVTNKENIMRGVSHVAKQAKQTHCIHGHILSNDNIHIARTGNRTCRQCHRNNSLKDYYKNRLERI